ncbi:polyprenyl synthetase family protein [Brevundimonas sp. SGAir0440]|uniref:polyprenyl synthetase family protein n=1 Tax=Brevundimonas sp. SGAir0440 TaxID=2579977 RepID=UPI00143D713B|nr:polyprenyl synthetase family protein [Brevundimonas sp. SGAir0440]
MAIVGIRRQPPLAGASCDPDDLRLQVQARLAEVAPAHDGLLSTAAREALLGQGKRVRPVLAMLAAAHVGGEPEDALDYACALEMVHVASLVLDDLPCMDDASLRRGQPTLHRRHGEDTAVLAAVALLNQATRLVLQTPAPAETRLAALDLLTQAIGFDGLSEGQMRDLRDDARDRDETALRQINDLKTGALFVATVRGGGLLGGGDAQDLARLSVFGEAIGFAFQLCDDLLDVCSTVDAVGKDVGQDDDTTTFVDLWGECRTRAAVRQSLAKAVEAVGHDSPLALYVLDFFQQAELGV